uniref:DBC1/CARP1 catalytically inactive NUDIX hydrolase domain-containing protein n=1 Tax=Anopheles maculatus TaxID=74869 RepID=A0A182TB80_9DIPT
MAFNQKNPPWQRNAGHQSMANMQAIVSFPQAQPNQPQSQPAPQPQQVNQNSPKFNPNNRAFSGTGLVTKLQNDYGIIDEQVFFHTNTCVKGILPKVGDRVLVDAAYNTNMPFKWNASRVQVLQTTNLNSSMASHTNSPTARAHASPAYASNAGSQNSASESRTNVRNRYNNNNAPARKSPDRSIGRRSSNSRSKDDVSMTSSWSSSLNTDANDSVAVVSFQYDDAERRRKRDDREPDRSSYREKPRARSPERARERERSPVKKHSPKRARLRSVPPYMVQVPKQLLPIKNVSILELRARYPKLYIPSDFFLAEVGWPKAFPPSAPLPLHTGCHFHVFNKEVERPLPLDKTILDPPDADYLYSVKVMLMSTPELVEIYKNCFYRNEKERRDEARSYLHPTRMVNFLVGARGKNELMAVGGPWSPSLDGTHPHTDPKVLMRTAIRTCKALTGIDLSACSLW